TGYAWEANYTRSWDQVQEDEGGSLLHSVEDLIARNRRKRLLGPGLAIRRAIIRHLILLIDLSAAMMDRDLRPTRFELALDCARAFVAEWCEQNPLGQVGVVGMRAGIGERIVEMTGNPHDVLRAIADKRKLEPAGEPSLQNAIEIARAGMRRPFACTLVKGNCDYLWFAHNMRSRRYIRNARQLCQRQDQDISSCIGGGDEDMQRTLR
ncbi:hypothetical protein FS749_012817, partial [Ceratobasidium sp. UAMH 11750]